MSRFTGAGAPNKVLSECMFGQNESICWMYECKIYSYITWLVSVINLRYQNKVTWLGKTL